MPLDFPNHPSLGQVFVSTGITWTYDGTKWVSVIPQDLTYLPTSGGTMTGPLTLAGNATGPLQAVPLQQAALTGISAEAYGVIADGTTDNTAALQAAINAVQTSVYEGKTAILRLPIGRMITGPLTVAGQITIEGSQSSGSVLVLKTGSTAACITIAPAGSAFPGGAPAGRIILKSVQIESQSIKTGSSTAHGIQTSASAPWSCHVTISDVTIYGMPGDGLNGPPSFNGGVDCYDCSFYNNLGNGVSCNSCNDWHWYGGVIGVNGGAGVVLSGCSQFVFTGTNIFSNGTHNLYLYSGAGVATGTHWFTDCMFDRGNQVGVLYAMAGQGGTTFKGCTFAGCSVTSPGTYSDVVIASGTNDLAVFSGCNWGNNHAADSTWPEKWALEFQSATGDTVVLDGSNTYYGGALQTNQFAQVFLTNAGTRNALNGPAVIVGDLWLGNGSSSATPAGRSLRATDGSGTDVAGANLVIAPGRGTGAGGPGAISFRFAPPGTAGSTLNAESERFYMSHTGARVTVTQQYTGFSVGNLTNSIFSVNGYTATADLGVMTLYNGGTGVIQFSAGSGYAPTYINQSLYMGNGSTSPTPNGQFIAATGGSGTNIAGAAMNIAGGAGTGTGIGGPINFYTSPAGTTGATQNSASLRMLIDTTGLVTFTNNATVRINGNVGFYNTAPIAKPTVSGAKGSNAALGSLMTALAALGLVIDSTTA